MLHCSKGRCSDQLSPNQRAEDCPSTGSSAGWASYCDSLPAVIYAIVGARPNSVKATPIHAAFQRAGIPRAVEHTGQHYDEAMSKVFFEGLAIPRPAVDQGVGSGTHVEQTGSVMRGLERHFGQQRLRAVLVVGDVNSTMAAGCHHRGDADPAARSRSR